MSFGGQLEPKVVAWLNPLFLGWVLPVAGALIVSIPLSVYTSRVALGQRARRAGVFMIPEELRLLCTGPNYSVARS